jgi:Protein of unknown function (DUF4089)
VKAPTKKKTGVRSRAASAAKLPAHAPLDDFVDAAAGALRLPLEPQWRPAVVANLEVILRLAAVVTEFPLPDDAEPAPIFRT